MSNFPTILLHVINSDQYPAAIGWGRNGSLWIDPTSFQKALRDHFQGVTKFASFTRKLNRYGFRKVIERNGSLDRVVQYQHKTFRQGISMAVASTIRIEKKKPKQTSTNDPKPVIMQEKDKRCAFSSVHKTPNVAMDIPMCPAEVDTSSTLQGLLRRQYCDWLLSRTALRPITTSHQKYYQACHTLSQQTKHVEAIDFFGNGVQLEDLLQTTVPGATSSLMENERLLVNPSLRYNDMMIPRANVAHAPPRTLLTERLYSLLRHQTGVRCLREN